MPELYSEFPDLDNHFITMGKTAGSDIPALFEISNSDVISRYIFPYLYQESMKFLETAIGYF